MSRRALALSTLLVACSGGHPTPSAVTTTLVATPASLPGDGVHLAQLRLTVRDAGGRPIADEPVSIDSNVPDITPAPSAGVTDDQGVFSATVSSTSGGTVLFFAAVGGFDVQTSVTFTLPACTGILQLASPEIPDGGFSDGGISQSVWSTGQQPPGWMQTADFNQDGDGDLAVLVPGRSLIMVFLGQGNGEFQAGPTIQLTATPIGLAVGDFNGDGQPDLAESEANTVNVFLGVGTGAFQQAVSTAVPGVDGPLVAGNFTAAATPGVAVLAGESIALLPAQDRLPPGSPLGQSEGTFLAPIITVVGVALSDLVALDANGDGQLDLAVSSVTADVVQVLPGSGLGTFGPASAVPGGQGPVALVAGDFNGDGAVDLAVANSSDATITLALGNGMGSFQAGAMFPGWSVTNPQALVAADFDTDGHLDLAIADQNGGDIALMLNTGDGGFLMASGFFYGSGGPAALITGDFAIDGTPNLVVGDVDVDTVGVLVAGCTPTPQWATLEATPASVAANGRAPITLTVTVRDNQGMPLPEQIVSLSIAMPSDSDGGTGDDGGTVEATLVPSVGTTGADGTFTATVTSATPGVATVLAQVGEVGASTSVSFLGGCGIVPSFTEDSSQTNSNPASVLVADFDQDGNLDFASGALNGLLCVSFGEGNEQFSASCLTTGNPVRAIATADFYGNGASCLATVGGNVVSLDPVLTTQTVIAPTVYIVPGVAELTALVTADFNDDGRPDLATIGNTAEVTVLLNAGDGTFAQPTIFATDVDPAGLVAADFNHDGNVDLAVASSGGGDVTVLLGNGDGTFAAGATIMLGANPTAIISADFNGDGIPDLATAQTTAGSVGVMLGKGDGTFAAPLLTSVGTAPVSLAAVAFGGNGPVDLLVGDSDAFDISVLAGSGNGTFQSPPTTIMPSPNGVPAALAVGDFSGDGLPDVVVACSTDPNGDAMSGFIALEMASCTQ